jgi:hypothetical protein
MSNTTLLELILDDDMIQDIRSNPEMHEKIYNKITY